MHKFTFSTTELDALKLAVAYRINEDLDPATWQALLSKLCTLGNAAKQQREGRASQRIAVGDLANDADAYFNHFGGDN